MQADLLSLQESEATAHHEQPPKYLRALLAVSRSPRKGEYLIVQFASGSFYRTDRLGAIVARALIRGASDQEAVALAERIEPGSGELARRLVYLLEAKGALAAFPPPRGPRGLRRRVIAASAGPVVSLGGRLAGVAPVAVVAGGFRALLSSRLANPRAGHSAGRMGPQRSFNYAFMFLSLCLSQPRLGRVLNRLFDPIAADEVAHRVQEEGATIGVFLHGPLCPAVPNVLRSRGCDVIRVVAPLTHGMRISSSSQPLRDFFGESPDILVADNTTLSIGPLLRHLKDGRSVYLALDNIIHVRDVETGDLSKPKAQAEVEMLGHRFPRNDMPAWLAARSGRPMVLWTTHGSEAGVVIKASPAIAPDPALPMEQRIAALSETLYKYAEAAILAHPEAWRYWTHINLMTVDQPAPG